jgi:hypothetical protein
LITFTAILPFFGFSKGRELLPAAEDIPGNAPTLSGNFGEFHRIRRERLSLQPTCGEQRKCFASGGEFEIALDLRCHSNLGFRNFVFISNPAKITHVH